MKKNILSFPNEVPIGYPSVYDNSRAKNNEYSVIIDNSSFKDKVRYYVTFIARDNTIAGHVFINWGFEDDMLQLSENEGCFGFYPIDESYSNLLIGKGTIEEELSRNRKYKATDYFKLPLKKLIVITDKDIYEKTKEIKERWFNFPPEYNLLTINCLSFATEIATVLNLKVPKNIFNLSDVLIFPWNYIDELVKLNK